MDTDGLRSRSTLDGDKASNPRQHLDTASEDVHPAGKVKHGVAVQILRAIVSMTFFLGSCLFLSVTQYVGAPLYFWNRDYFYAFMALTKQSFAILIIVITRVFSPTPIRVSWDSSMQGQFRRTKDGTLETLFPERMILIANHQIYTDWVFMWWIAYTSRMHGHIFIILKESLKYIPFLGTGMMFYGFIFMARKWETDKPRIQYRLEKLKSRHGGPLSGTASLDPMWLLVFPEGTNLSANTRKKSVAWSEKSGLPDMKHQLLPRSTGMFFCLQQLRGTVDWVYDCTIAYEGVPLGGYAQDYFTLRSTYLQGRPPKSVHLYWRRYAVSEIPLDDQKAFELWIEKRWREKDDLLEQYKTTGRFPAAHEDNSKESKGGTFIDTEVKLKSPFEVLQIYIVVLTVGLLINIVLKFLKQFGLR